MKRAVRDCRPMVLALLVVACGDEGASMPAQPGGAVFAMGDPLPQAMPMDAANPMPATDPANAPTPLPLTVTGPVTGGMGEPLSTSVADLAMYGYVENEFFFEADATAYAPQGDMVMSGKWQLMETTRAPFKTRLLVRHPVDGADFNGTVVVEWLNVSGGTDGDPGFMFNWQEILREGYAWAGVSAQSVGVEGGGFALVEQALPLKEYDPERYGSLSHPGDMYSYDIYTQAAQVLRGAGGVDVLGGLQPERLIAYGESQSAMRLVSYVNGVHPIAQAFDGFFIHSRAVSGVTFGEGNPFGFNGTPAHIRDDLAVPVFQFQTETDVGGMFGFYKARQPDTDLLRTWEVAGTAHADAYLLTSGPSESAGILGQCGDINEGPQHFVLKAALHSLNQWMTDGTLPAQGERLMLDDNGDALTDEHGNSLGGIRTPAVDAPISILSGYPASEDTDVLCSLFGSTMPFSVEKLRELYPTHEDYVAQVTASAAAAREAGFVLEPEELAMVAAAEAAPIPE